MNKKQILRSIALFFIVFIPFIAGIVCKELSNNLFEIIIGWSTMAIQVGVGI